MKRVKNAGVIFAIYWWKLLMENELSAIRWVDGPEIELIAIATSSRIVPRFEELILEKFDYATVVNELTFDIKNRMLVFEKAKALEQLLFSFAMGTKWSLKKQNEPSTMHCVQFVI